MRRGVYAATATLVVAALVVHKVGQSPEPIASEDESSPQPDSPWAALIKEIAAERDVVIDALDENFAYLRFRSNSGKTRWGASVAYNPDTDHFTSHSTYPYANSVRSFVGQVAQRVRAAQEIESPGAGLT